MNMASLKMLEIIMGRYGLLVRCSHMDVQLHAKCHHVIQDAVTLFVWGPKHVIACTVIRNDLTCYIIDMRPKK